MTDVSALGGVDALILAECKVADVSALGTMRHLDLTGCCDVTDVSALGGVDTGILAGCKGMVDVFALGTVRRLDLSDCSNVTNASALGSVTYLNLTGSGVRDYRPLRRVRHISVPTREPLYHPWQ